MRRANALYVGIDVANLTLEVSFLGEDARPVRGGASFSNDPEGHTALCAAAVAAARLVGSKPRIVFGMESTSNMHKRLEQRLRAEKRRSAEVHVINPRSVKHFAKVLLSDNKTDAIDSRIIARYLISIEPKPAALLPDGSEELREATRTRRRLIEERTQSKNRLHGLMRFHLPGYHSKIGRQLTKGILTVLNAYPTPAEILAASDEELTRLTTGPRSRVGVALAAKMKELAAAAPQPNLGRTTALIIRTTAARVLELSAIIDEMDRGIEELLAQVYPDQVLTTIPGVGPVSAASILAEIGDVHRFTDATAFIGYCGLYPIVWQSGEASRHYRMTFKGNAMLKMTFLVASAAARQYNPAIAAYYERLRRRGKSTKAAGGAIARKLAQIVFAVLVSGKPWSAEIASAGIDRGTAMAGEDAAKTETGADCLIGEMRAPHEATRPYSRSGGSRISNVAKEASHAQP
ncbi:MAG TPA: IS110 family transposase [Spirochaetia bacterium]|nr:IS110 family transposase [Spirochaetia bacterium]